MHPWHLEVLRMLDGAAQKRNIKYFLLGATARDVLMNYLHGIVASRVTMDIDFGVNINSWNDFQTLSEELLSRGFKTGSVSHRFFYNEAVIDIVPFGGIAEDSAITWPGAKGRTMSVLGFDEAYNSSKEYIIQSEPELKIRLISIEGLVILKIISWDDAYPKRPHDADDLVYLIKNYLIAGNEERLYDEHADLLEIPAPDYERSGARLLGRTIAGIISPQTRIFLLDLFSSDKRYKLISNMAKSSSLPRMNENNADYCESLIKNLEDGIRDIE